MGYTFRVFVLFLNFLIIYAEPLGKPSMEVKSVNERKYFGVDTYISISRSAGSRGIKLDVVQNGEIKQEGLVGLNVPNDVDVQVIHGDNGESKYVFGETLLVMTPIEAPGGQLIKIQWRGVNRERMQDCYNLGEYNWYGGPENWYQAWPIEQLVFNEYSYVTKGENSCAVAEPYWLSSSGLFFHITQDIPLFVDQNNWQDNWVCFISDIKAPYSERRTDNNLNYVIGLFSDPRQAHEFVTNDLFKKPKGVPDYRMTQHPIWSTWAEYKKDIDEATVMDFAQKILDNNFNNSQLEIDDLWETCYGSFNVDTNKFPDLKRLTDNLKAKGFRVTLWIHPFINQGCEPWYTEALENGYFVRNEQGSVDTQWWNSNGATAAYIDFTNPEAAAWWSGRLRNLQTTYGIDSFKFDAGESGSSPQVPVQTGDINLHPGLITTSYVETCAEFGSMIEVRSAKASQDLAVYVRMIDKDSRWTLDNGLPTVLTTLLQMNMNGYPFVLPDMIGGNGYNGRPSKELFIRWLQANVFMPSLQYSYVPWDYDQETTDICRKFTDLHAQYADIIMDTFRIAVKDGSPVNPPIWWVDPTSKAAHPIWDEYLLGEDIVVAPILEENAVSRNIYLPIGEWLAEGDPARIYQGRNWILDYPAPLDTLPYFIRAPIPQN